MYKKKIQNKISLSKILGGKKNVEKMHGPLIIEKINNFSEKNRVQTICMKSSIENKCKQTEKMQIQFDSLFSSSLDEISRP